MLPIAKNITQKARCILTMQRTFSLSYKRGKPANTNKKEDTLVKLTNNCGNREKIFQYTRLIEYPCHRIKQVREARLSTYLSNLFVIPAGFKPTTF